LAWRLNMWIACPNKEWIMSDRFMGRERRKHRRYSVPATLTLARGREYLGTYLVHDVSRGGALVHDGPELEVGEEVRVMLHLPGQQGISTNARVVRQATSRSGGPAYGLAFQYRSAGKDTEIKEAIANALLAVRARQGRVALVIDGDNNARAALARELNLLGHVVIYVATVEEATAVLSRSDDPIDLVFVDLSLANDKPQELMTMLRAHRRKLRYVVMSDRMGPGELRMEAASLAAHGNLTKPWDPRHLAQVVMAGQ
jgi:CheY-like chemotaxis protein